MNIFDYAMQLESEGEQFYRALSGKTKQDGLIKIFNWLADEEVKHYNAFQDMKNHQAVSLQSTQLFDNVKSIFEEMRTRKVFDFDASQVALYRKAQEIEKKSEDFYMEKSVEVNDPSQKKILETIAAEEQKHYFLLDNIIELVSRPEAWLENAEWHHQEEY